METALFWIVFIGTIAVYGWFKYQQAQAANTPESVKLKEYVKGNTAISSYVDLHLYSDRLIWLKTFEESESQPITEVSAIADETGAVHSRSTLARSAVPGMHGWQKKDDNRKAYIVVDGPDFQWQVEYPTNQSDLARKFISAVNTKSRQARKAVDPTISRTDISDE